MRSIISCFICVMIFNAAQGQQLLECDSTHYYWAFEKEGSCLAVKLEGKARKTETKSLISVDHYVLQYVIADKKNYLEGLTDTGGLMPLISYAQSEGGYIAEQFHSHLDLKMLKAPIDSQNILIWSFDMPPAVAGNVKSQIFVNMVVGDKIFGLSSSQFDDSISTQSYEEIKDFLVKVISSVKQLSNIKTLSSLCSK